MNFLPIGSVVKLTNLEKPVMIFGYLQETALAPGKVADYVGVPYPEGNISLQYQILFMVEDIAEVLFEGYRTEETRAMELIFFANKLPDEETA